MRGRQCKYVVLCAPDGGIVNDPILLRVERDRFWLSLADSDALLFALGAQAFAGMDVQIHEPDVSPLQVQGRKSKPLIRKLFGDAIADLRYYRCSEAELDGIPLVVSRTGWTGEVGYELYLRDATRGTELWDRVMSAGEEFRIRAIAPSDQRRMEAGIFNYGNDMDVTNNPFEVTGWSGWWSWATTARSSRVRRSTDRGRGRRARTRRGRLGGEPLTMWLEDFWPVTSAGREVGA
jgi:aminomethyltransferase